MCALFIYWYVLDEEVEKPKECELGSASHCEWDSADLDDRGMHVFVYICIYTQM